MLSKLLKYEIPALGRKLGPLYIALAATAILLGLSLRFEKMNADLLTILSALLYVGVCVAIFVMTIILVIQRYHNSLLGDEAYFNLVLPVTASEHIMNKAISAVIWTTVATIAAIISALLIGISAGALDKISWADLKEAWNQLMIVMNGKNIVIIIEVILGGILSSVKSILAIYAAITMGHQIEQKPVLASIGAYILLMMFETTVGRFFAIIDFTNGSWFANSQKFALLGFIIVMLLCALYFFICKYLMEKKLNLN
jgi:hypothetical protein